MDHDPLPDPGPDESSDGVNHIAYVLLAVVLMLIFWWGRP